jgi:predicted N-formylglutamate amidohydrolase
MSEIEVDDHAGNIMPRALGHLGIAEAECERHTSVYNADGESPFVLVLIQQNYSHLVITVEGFDKRIVGWLSWPGEVQV